jgi:hypothetical protein
MQTANLGVGWRPLCEELEQELGRLEPPGELLAAEVDVSGLLSFRVKLDPKVKTEGRRLVREYQDRAAELCETCGGPGRVRAGVVVTARCDHCV